MNNTIKGKNLLQGLFFNHRRLVCYSNCSENQEAFIENRLISVKLHFKRVTFEGNGNTNDKTVFLRSGN